MLSIDLKNALHDPSTNNFTCMLMRLLMKADEENTRKIASQYPEVAQIVWLYKNSCSYKDADHNEVDFELLEQRARFIVKNNDGFTTLVLPGDDKEDGPYVR